MASIDHEIRESNTLLDEIDSSVPKDCIRFMIGGNHEARFERFKVNHGFEVSIRRLKDFSNWYHEYNLPQRGWGYCEYGETHEIGKIVFTHGWFIGGNHAQRHLNLWHKNLIYGHSHQFQVATGSGLDGKPVLAASIGTLSKMNLSYLMGKPPISWINMFAFIEMREDGTFTPNFIPIVDGTFIALGKEFGP